MKILKTICVVLIILIATSLVGCTKDGGTVKITQENSTKENRCTQTDKEKENCQEIFLPVCGWFNSTMIQCFKYPCAANYANNCYACADEKVDYWTEGECPK